MKKLLCFWASVLWTAAPYLASAQATDTIYNWNKTQFSANGTQATRVKLGRAYYNSVHWGMYASAKFTLRQNNFSSGVIEYMLTVGEGNAVLVCQGAYGANVDKGRLTLGPQISAGISHMSAPTYYRDIFLDMDYYTYWLVSAHVTGSVFAFDKYNLVTGDEYQYMTLFTSPTIENIPSFMPDVKNIILADGNNNRHNVGIGTTNPQGKLHIYKSTTGDYDGTLVLDGPVNSERSIIFNDEGQFAWWFGRDNTAQAGLHDGIGFFNQTAGVAFVIKDDGRVAIGGGFPKPDAKLTVGGTIHATKIKVEQTVWADHVFEPNYQLPSLHTLETYIRQNKHLPQIPSAKEVITNGVDLGEMNMKLLQKIEELTLHLIDQNKRLEALEKENREMRKNKK